jgi:hypothetical protein
MIIIETISTLHVVPATEAPVVKMLSPEEKQFLDLLAEIHSAELLKSVNNEQEE